MAKLAIYRLGAMMIGCLLTFAGVTQLRLQIKPVDSASTLFHAINYQSSFKSRQALADYLRVFPATLQAKGFLSAAIDTVISTDSGMTAHLFLGEQYRWKRLSIAPADRLLVQQLGYRLDDHSVVEGNLPETLPAAIVNYFQENGYPFASVGWDSLNIIGNEITAALAIDKGPLYRLDSIGMSGTAKISMVFLTRYLDLPRGSIYRRSVLDAIDRKLQELPYLEQSQPWQLQMHSTGYVINFYLRPRRSNTVDALVGLLPSNQQNGGRLLLTVDANLLLRNALGGGETIDFSWEQIQPRSPRLNIFFQQPFVFRSAFGLDLGFHLYKKDSGFLNIDGRAGLQYSPAAYQNIRLMLQTQRTNLLDVDTASIKFSRRLPDMIDLQVLSLGFEYNFNNTNYRFNPRKGNEVLISTTAGTKSIRRNNTITGLKDGSFNYNSLYDSIDLNSYQLRLRLAAARYFPMGRQSTLKGAVQVGLLQTPEYFRNEMFQIGGYRLLRGFDEESIFANRFAVATAEYRYLLGLNSYLFVFSDLGFSRFTTREFSASHNYLGFGTGMAFQSRQGIFNISIAAGKRNDLPFNLRQAKIHLGYTSFF